MSKKGAGGLSLERQGEGRRYAWRDKIVSLSQVTSWELVAKPQAGRPITNPCRQRGSYTDKMKWHTKHWDSEHASTCEGLMTCEVIFLTTHNFSFGVFSYHFLFVVLFLFSFVCNTEALTEDPALVRQVL